MEMVKVRMVEMEIKVDRMMEMVRVARMVAMVRVARTVVMVRVARTVVMAKVVRIRDKDSNRTARVVRANIEDLEVEIHHLMEMARTVKATREDQEVMVAASELNLFKFLSDTDDVDA